tara:strand:+ start:204 stop:467 length:264 start_codon:yes stop_codon:yes gene_type:complete
MEKQVKKSNLFVGEVVSDKMDKTVVAKVVRRFKHPLFGKVLRQDKRYKVHDPEGIAKMGDTIEFYEGRPLSKTKHMYLSRVITKQTV